MKDLRDGAQQDGVAQRADLAQAVDQLQVLFDCLAKTNAGIQQDGLVGHAGLARQGHAFEQFGFDLAQQVGVLHAHVAPAQALAHLGVGGFAAVVHQDQPGRRSARATPPWPGRRAAPTHR